MGHAVPPEIWAGQGGLGQCCQAFGFCIDSVEPTVPAPSCMESRESNRWEGGTVPFKNLAGLALNAWPAERSSEPGPTPAATRHAAARLPAR